MYHSLVKSALLVLVGLGVGAVLSWVTDTIYPTLILFLLALIVGLLLVFWSRIAEPRLKVIRDGLKMDVAELVPNAKYGMVRVVFSVASANKHVCLKAFDKALIGLDSEKASKVLQLEKAVQLTPPSTSVEASFAILPKHIAYLLSKKRSGQEVSWEFSPESQTRCSLDTRWGKTVWVPKIKTFRQIPRIT